MQSKIKLESLQSFQFLAFKNMNMTLKLLAIVLRQIVCSKASFKQRIPQQRNPHQLK